MAPLPVKKKMTFKVPADCTSDNGGALSMCPSYQQSPIFTAGGCDWTMSYSPENTLYPMELSLSLETGNSRATILYSVDLVDPTGTLPPDNLAMPQSPETVEYLYDDWMSSFVTCSVPRWLDKRYLKRGSFTFRWTITILSAETPESRMGRHKLPAETDVTFFVGGERFDAHMFVLALRSPVFKTELFGGTLGMRDDDDDDALPLIVVEDMRPDVFKALLCYIYTDDLPPPAEEDESDMLCHLLVAADRYHVRGLKDLCQAILSRKLDVENVAKMLSFADDHCCSTLKDACVEFMADSDMMNEVVAAKATSNSA